jgi:hypothetical protein
LPTEEEANILRRAVERGFATQQQVDALLADLAAIEQLGGKATVPELMVKKMLCTPGQVEMLRETTLLPQAQPVPLEPATTPASLTPTPEAGTTELAGFKIIGKIGGGGMGVVFKAMQVSMDRVVALKVLSPKLAANKAYIERFLREARAAAKLDHPNIVRGIDAGLDKGYYFLAMEYVDGESVSQRLQRLGRIEERDALSIVLQAAQALDHAQQAGGIIHRDIKPDNILITAAGIAKLADLGLAKSTEDDAGLTRVGATIGTPHYVSPEQARGEQNLDTRSDIYSLGATLYHMVTGSPPFSGETPSVVLSRHVNEPLVPTRQRNPNVSPSAAAIVEKMLQKDPAKRYQTPAELIEDLECALEGKELAYAKRAAAAPKPAEAQKPRAPAKRDEEPRRSPTPYIIGGTLAAAAVIVAVIVIFARPPKPPAEPPKVAEQPKPDPAKEQAEQRSREAAEALQKAHDFASKHETDFALVAAEFDAVAKRFPGTASAKEAESAVKQWRLKWIAAGDKEYERLKQEVDDLIAKKQFGAAIKRAATLPQNLLTRQVQEKQKKLLEEIPAQAQAAYDEMRTQAEALAAESKFEDALKLLAVAQGMGIDDLVAKATKLSDEIRQRQQATLTEAQKAAQEFLKKLDTDLLDALSKRDYARAETVMTAARADKMAQGLRGDVDSRGAVIAALGRFWAKVNKGAETLIAKKARMTVKDKEGVVVAVKEGRLMVDLGGVQLPRELKSLTTRELAKIAEAACDEKSGADHALLGVFYMAEGDTRQAQAELAKAKGLGEDVAAYLACVETFARGAEEREAAQLFDKATAAANEKDWKAASDLLETLMKEHGESGFAKANAERIDALSSQVEEALAAKTEAAELVAELKKLDDRAKALEAANLFADAIEVWEQFAEKEVSRPRMLRLLTHARKVPVAARFGKDAKDYGISQLAGPGPGPGPGGPSVESVTIEGKNGVRLGNANAYATLALKIDPAYTVDPAALPPTLTIGVEVYSASATSRIGVDLLLSDFYGMTTLRPLSYVPPTPTWAVIQMNSPYYRPTIRTALGSDVQITGSNINVRSVWARLPNARGNPLERLVMSKLAKMNK